MQKNLTHIYRHWLGVFRTTLKIWLEGRVFVHAAALAFFTVFSIAPVLIVAVMLVGLVFDENVALVQLTDQLRATIGDQASLAVQTAIENSRIEKAGMLPAIAGFGAMLFGATTVFAQMQGALNSIWGVAPKPTQSGILVYVMRRLLSLTVVLGIGFVMLVSMTLSVAVRATIEFTQNWLAVHSFLVLAIDWVISLLVITLLFASIFRILPDVLLEWRDVLVGAFVTALLFVTGRALIAIYLSTAAPASTYGAAGSLVLLLMWVNYSSLILLFGAAFTRAQLEARGGTIRPRSNAVCVSYQVVAD
ncbi:YihY/virulence factor BrkB family protein [Orrella marina]|uniref:YihY/virulence factor BrkB family protein n=1 Tax=Orrella marina TaxID=2163011 RepID=A0A2R4XPI9_9BURK|nr:YihY/virulence factor BrkB family protein [Orrella marina]AWB35691.1 YihY/virulence factor BrkB family protein [Orrella marina]